MLGSWDAAIGLFGKMASSARLVEKHAAAGKW